MPYPESGPPHRTRLLQLATAVRWSLVWGEDEVFPSSDVPDFLPWTRSALFLDDGKVVRLRPREVEVCTLKDGSSKRKPVVPITWDPAMAEKTGFQHFMLKEIYEQPRAILDGQIPVGTLDPISDRRRAGFGVPVSRSFPE